MILSVVCVLIASKYGDKAAWPDSFIMKAQRTKGVKQTKDKLTQTNVSCSLSKKSSYGTDSPTPGRWRTTRNSEGKSKEKAGSDIQTLLECLGSKKDAIMSL